MTTNSKTPEKNLLQANREMLLERWLNWNGIIGFTQDIIDIMTADAEQLEELNNYLDMEMMDE